MKFIKIWNPIKIDWIWLLIDRKKWEPVSELKESWKKINFLFKRFTIIYYRIITASYTHLYLYFFTYYATHNRHTAIIPHLSYSNWMGLCIAPALKLSPPATNVIEIFIPILIVNPTWYPETGMRSFSKADSQQLKETAIHRYKNKSPKAQTKVSPITKDVRVLTSE